MQRESSSQRLSFFNMDKNIKTMTQSLEKLSISHVEIRDIIESLVHIVKRQNEEIALLTKAVKEKK